MYYEVRNLMEKGRRETEILSREYKGWEKSIFNMAICRVPYISDWSIFKNQSVDCMANIIFQSFPQTHPYHKLLPIL